MEQSGAARIRLLGLLLFCPGSLFGWTDEYRRIEQDAYAVLTGKELAKAAFGMRVQGARDSGDTVRVTTTGGVFVFDRKAKTIGAYFDELYPPTP